MPHADTSPISVTRLLLPLASAIIVLAGMRAAAPVIGPVLIAILITVAWSPGSRWLRDRGWPPAVAALTGIVLGVAVIALIGLLVGTSLVQLQGKLPEYQQRVEILRGSLSALLARLPIESSQVLSAEALQPSALVGSTLRVIRGITTGAGALGLLIIIMAFIMIEAVRYPQKLYEAIRTTEASTGRIGAFVQSLRSYVVINTIFGLVAAVLNTVLMLALGVDFALLWGVLSFLLSFLPNIGFVLALVPPALLALLEFGVSRAVMVVVGFTVINFIADNVIKPRFVGETLDLSPAVVVISLVFWGWLLGPVGALLAVPLSIALRFGFEAFGELRWLAHLMSDRDPVVPPGAPVAPPPPPPVSRGTPA